MEFDKDKERGLRHVGRSLRANLRAEISIWSIGAIFLGLLATVLFILAVGVYYAYFPSSLVANLTDGELGVLGFVAAAAAVACEVVARRRR
jgi:hypothetical protein